MPAKNDSLLTLDEARGLFSYDPATGVVSRLTGRYRGPVSTISRGYVVVRVPVDRKTNRSIRAHRLAWFLHYGKWPEGEVDHINGDRSDNRLSNLRDVPGNINRQNQRCARKDNSVGVRGVRLATTPGKFTAQIASGGVTHHLGTFDSIEAAQTAYETARYRLHPGSRTLVDAHVQGQAH